MDTPKTELTRRTGLGKLAAGALVAIGLAFAAASPAMADNWKHNNNGHGQWNQWNDGHGNKHWKKKKQQHVQYYYQPNYHYHQQRPKVIYVQPQPVYVAPPPVYYYQPAPVYHRPNISIVFPLDFD